MRVDYPSFDAAIYHEPRLIAAEAANQQLADDLKASRKACDAIKAISRNDLTPEVFAQLVTVLSAAVAGASWNCTDKGETCRNVLNALHDDIVYGGAL